MDARWNDGLPPAARRRLGAAAGALLAATVAATALVVPASAAPRAPRVAARPRLLSAATPVIPQPVEAATAFAATRGPGYEQVLNAARQQASQLVPAVLPAGNMATTAWTPLGPSPMLPTVGALTSPNAVNYGGANAGRVTGLAVSPSGTLFAAAAGGGVWSSTTNGASWTTTTDSQPDIAMGSVAVDPSDPSLVFAGTGEDNQCADCFYGDGILESFDGGTTWTTSNPGGVFTGPDVASVAFVPGASSVGSTEVLAGTSSGLYVSTDAGSTWTAEAGNGWRAGNVSSIVVNPNTTPPAIYAGVGGVGVEMTTDNGADWTLEASNFPSPTSYTSVALALVPTGSTTTDTLYASLGGNTYEGLYRSTAGGAGFTQIINVPAFTTENYAFGAGVGDQASYDNAIAVDPLNANILVLGGVTAVEGVDNAGTWNWTNLNGGTFGTASNQFHPDFHAMVFDAAGDLYVGNDGGVWELPATDVNSATPAFSNLNGNLDITQFYAGMSVYGNGSQILAGAQDNGTPLYSATSATPTTWAIEDTGDGGAALIDPLNPLIQYAEADIGAGGSLDMTTDGWATSMSVTPALASANWYAPMAYVPGATPQVLFGADQLYEVGAGQLGPWTTRIPPGTLDIAAIAVAPSNPSVIYVARDDGSISVSINGGVTWTAVTPPAMAQTQPTHLAVSPTNPSTLYVTYAAAIAGETGAANPAVLVGTGLGVTTPVWTNVSGNLPANVPTSSVIADGSSGLIVANDVGVFLASTLNGAGTTWARLGTGLPNVQVTDVALTSGGTLLAETHGRGIWSLPFVVPGTADQLAVTSGPPGSLLVGQSFTVTVAVEDILGTQVGADAGRAIALAIANGTGTPGAALTCATNPVDDVNGVATFQCSVNAAGAGYQLVASSTGLAPGTTAGFTTTAPVTSGGGATSAPSSTGTPVGLAPTPTPPPPTPTVSVVGRYYGQQSIDTAIATSKQAFPQSDSATAVVLASSTSFADELAAGPLAAHVGGPLLLTGGSGSTTVLDPRVVAEIQRVLAPGGTVDIVGGDLAVPAGADATLQQDGYVVHRLAGSTAPATAVAVAEALGNPSTVFEVTDTAPWDGIAAAPAAIAAGGAILLTNGRVQAPETAAYLQAHPADTRYAVGGTFAAAGADPSATAVAGATAEATSAAVAARFFPTPNDFGAASTLDFQDGLVGGLYMATGGRSGPLLLVDPNATPLLDPAVVSYLRTLAPGTPGTVFGGPLAFPFLDLSQLQVYAGMP